jgi:hypothetical protein
VSLLLDRGVEVDAKEPVLYRVNLCATYSHCKTNNDSVLFGHA